MKLAGILARAILFDHEEIGFGIPYTFLHHQSLICFPSRTSSSAVKNPNCVKENDVKALHVKPAGCPCMRTPAWALSEQQRYG